MSKKSISILQISFLKKKSEKTINIKILRFKTRFPAIKLITSDENKRFMIIYLVLVFVENRCIKNYISCYLRFFNNYLFMTKIVKSAPVAQLDRAFGYGPEGSGFKS